VLYEPVSWLVSRGAWAGWVRAAAPFVEGPALEIGPGTGHLLVELRASGIDVVGLDRSAELLARARQRLEARRRRDLAPGGDSPDQDGGPSLAGAPLVRADAAALPFAGVTFRTVVTTFPAPFAAEASVLAEVGRLLAEGGTWVILDGAVPGGDDPWSRLVRLLLAPLRRAPGEDATGPEAPCRTLRGAAAFATLLVAAGFAVERRVVAVGPDRVTVLLARRG
jgi:SAM-dependent methyltransferase